MADSYHHGDLREALLREALQLLVSKGEAALSLRAVARQAGVSHTAPYRHFRDKAGLLHAVADEGFDALSQRLDAAQAAAGPDPLARFRALGRAYIDFALAMPDRFRLMFGREVVAARHQSGDLGAAGAPFQRLLDTIEAAQSAAQVRSGPLPPLALAAWAGVHGCALLCLDGLIPPEAAPRDPLIDQLLQLCYEGLAP